MSNEEIDKLLKEIDLVDIVETIENDIVIEDIINNNKLEDDRISSWQEKTIEIKNIENEILPLPANDKTQVIQQLRDVSSDSENKVSQIFDALDILITKNDEQIELIKENIELLEKTKRIYSKIPINVLKKEIEIIDKQLIKNAQKISILNETNNLLFSTLELMQFNDLNRQKLERVIGTIRSLNDYLSYLFFDKEREKDVPIAKHIHGDKDDSLSEEDIEKMIKNSEW